VLELESQNGGLKAQMAELELKTAVTNPKERYGIAAKSPTTKAIIDMDRIELTLKEHAEFREKSAGKVQQLRTDKMLLR